MGENARENKIIYVLNIIDKALKELGFKTDKDLVTLFNKFYDNKILEN